MNSPVYLYPEKKIENSVAKAVISLHQKGYSYDFKMIGDEYLLCIQNNRTFTFDELVINFIDEYYDSLSSAYRFIHTIETECGISGLIVTPTPLLNQPNIPNMNRLTQGLEERLDPITFQMIKELFEKRVRVEDRLLVRFKDKILPIPFNDIAFFFLEHELTQLVTFEGRTYIIQKTLDELEKQAGLTFFRANRQHLVSKAAIRDLSTSLNRSITVNLKFQFPARIEVSRNKSGQFLEWLSVDYCLAIA
jgi:hypothetical protein